MAALNLKQDNEKEMDHRRNIANALRETIVATVEEEIKEDSMGLSIHRAKKKKKKMVNDF
jgi:hypothetical protein